MLYILSKLSFFNEVQVMVFGLFKDNQKVVGFQHQLRTNNNLSN